MSTSDRERLAKVAEVLAEHFVMWHELPTGGPSGEWRCQCGKKFGFSDSAIQHQAEAIASGAVRPAAEVRAEVVAAVEAWLATQVDSLGGQFHLVRVADLRAALAASEPDAGERDA